MIRFFNRFPSYLYLLCSLLLLSSCGGGGSSGTTPPGAGSNNSSSPGGNNDDATSPSPLSQQECEANDNYQWLNDDCTLAGNPLVKHIELIEALPENDKQNMIDWLNAVDKQASVHAMLPNTFDNESSDHVLDKDLLQSKHTDNNFLPVNDSLIVLGTLSPRSGEYKNFSSRQRSVNGNSVISISAGIEISGGQAVVSLYEQEVYRFDAVSKLEIEAHINNSVANEASAEISSYSLLTTQEQNNARLTSNAFIAASHNAIKANANSKTVLQNALSLSDAFIENQTELAQQASKPVAGRLIIDDVASNFFGQESSPIYLDKATATALMQADEFSAGIELVLRATDLGSSSYRNQKQMVIINGTLLAEKHSEPRAGVYSFNTQFEQAGNFQLLDVDAAGNTIVATDELFKTINLLRDSGERFFHNDASWQAHPGYSTAAIDLIPLAESEVIFIQSILDLPALRDKLLQLASPYYYSLPNNASAYPVESWSKWYNNDLAKLLWYPISVLEGEDITAAGYMEGINLWLTSQQGNAFYSDLSSVLDTLLSEIDTELLNTYTPTLLATYVKLAYFKLLTDNTLPSATELAQAIRVAGETYSAALRAEIRALSTLALDNSIDRNFIIDEEPVNAINTTETILSNANKALLAEHDQKALKYAVPAKAPTVFNLYRSTDGKLAEHLQQKIQTLDVIDSFLITQDISEASSKATFEKGEEMIAARAYEEDWALENFNDLDTIKSFFSPRGVISSSPCEQESLLEWLGCVSRYNNEFSLLSIEQGEGYLASVDGKKPFIEHASTFVDIKNTVEALLELQGSRIYSLSIYYDYYEALEKGIWLACSGNEIENNIASAKEKIDAYHLVVAAEPKPSGFSDEYDRQEALKDEIVELLNSCPR